MSAAHAHVGWFGQGDCVLGRLTGSFLLQPSTRSEPLESTNLSRVYKLSDKMPVYLPATSKL